MKSDELPLPKLLDLLRAKGVRVFRDGALYVELATPAAVVPATVDASPEEGPPTKCRCGHAVWEHQNGLCIVGCEADKCVEPPKL